MVENRQHKLGFIGTGLMGAPMTKRFLGANFYTSVWNRTREKILPLLEAGAKEKSCPGEVAKEATIVFMCLTDASAVERAVFGKEGISSGGKEGKLLVDFSSIRPDLTRQFASQLKSSCGMGWVDAPVSGGVKGAQEGTLAILVGGEIENVERVRPIVKHLCQRFTHMGPVGSGQVTKLCNQVIVGSNIVAISEAVNLARRAGVDASKLHEALSGGFGDSIPLQIFGPRFATFQTEPLLGHIFTMLKDLDTARELGMETNSPLPMSTMAAEALRNIASKGYSNKDITNLIRLFGDTEE